MTRLINSLDDIFEQFPHVILTNNEPHSACPFCAKSEDDTIYQKNDIVFIGTDRFFWFAQAKNFYCRRCGTHTLEEVCQQIFGSDYTIHPEFVEEVQNYVAPVHELFLHDEDYVEELHRNVRRAYWYKFGWTDATIDRFKLGYGKMYEFSTKAERHIIPFKPVRVDGWKADGYALDGRLSHNVKGESQKTKTQGLSSQFFDEIIEGHSNIAVICEGIKDGITAWQLGFRHIYSFNGNTTDLVGFAAYIKAKNYDKVVAFIDDDTAGQRYLKQISEFDFNELYTLRWPDNVKKGYDLTNLLEEFGKNTNQYIEQNLYRIEAEIPVGFIPDIRPYWNDYQAPTADHTISKKQVRDELPKVLKDFIDDYANKRRYYGRGVVKVLGADPGSGKSYALARMAENLAKTGVEAFKIQYEALSTVIADLEAQIEFAVDADELLDYRTRIERYTNQRNNLSCATVLYAGPFITGWDDILAQGADPDLWYNYEARNESNCDNLSTVTQLAAKGYTPMAYCQAACPLKAACEQKGYLSQEAKRRAKPITYVRHQQLVTNMVNDYQYIIIDENCLSVFDEPIVVSQSELIPTHEFWDSFVEADQIKLIAELIEAIRVVLQQADPYEIVSGRAVMDRINDQLLGNLLSTLLSIDPQAIAQYQPKTVMGQIDMSTVPVRCIPALYDALMEELDLYEGDQLNYNSSIHIVKQQLELYSLKNLHIPSSHPIIVSDGTPLPELYGILFDREVETYSPQLYDERAKTTVLYGSDFTRSSIQEHMGFALQDFDDWMKQNRLSIEDIFGDEFDLTTLPFDDNMYDNSLMKRIITLVKKYAEQHSSLLFVTHKQIRLLIEKRIQEVYPELYDKIHFAHYWSLRGTNRYKDVEAVLLVGCPRIPYENLYRKIQCWGKLAGIPWFSGRITRRLQPYHGVNRYEAASYPTFDNEFADSFVNMIESGEITQSLQRIRMFTSEIPKYAYVAASRPAVKWVTSLDRVGELVNRTVRKNQNDAYQFMKEYFIQNKAFPKARDVMKQFKISSKKVANFRRLITDEIAVSHSALE